MSEKEIRSEIAAVCEELDRRRGKLARLLLPAVAALTLGASDGGTTTPPDAATNAVQEAGSDAGVDAAEGVAMYSAPGCGC